MGEGRRPARFLDVVMHRPAAGRPTAVAGPRAGGGAGSLSMHDAARPVAPGGGTPETRLPGPTAMFGRLRHFSAPEAVFLRSLAASDPPPAPGAPDGAQERDPQAAPAAAPADGGPPAGCGLSGPVPCPSP